MKWRNKQLDTDMNFINDVVKAIRRLRSINNFNKNQSESNVFYDLLFDLLYYNYINYNVFYF